MILSTNSKLETLLVETILAFWLPQKYKPIWRSRLDTFSLCYNALNDIHQVTF